MLGESGVTGGVLGEIFVSGTVESFPPADADTTDADADADSDAGRESCFLFSDFDERLQWMWLDGAPLSGVCGVFGVDVDVDVAVTVALPAVSALPPFSFKDCKWK